MTDAIQNWITELQNHQASARGEPLKSRVATAVAALNEIEAFMPGGNSGPDKTVLANISGGVGSLTPVLLTAVLDAVFGTTRGSLIERGAAGWVLFPPVGLNTILTSGGVGQDLLYQSIAGVLETISTTQGAITYAGGGAAWTALLPGTAGALLQTGGAGANPAWSTLGQLAGATTNDNANAGNIGEFISSTVTAGSAVSLTSLTAANVTSISLTPGDWTVSGSITFSPAGTTSTAFLLGSHGTTSATYANTPGFASNTYVGGVVPGGFQPTLMLPTQRYSLSATTTVYLVASSSFSVSTLSAFGNIIARRAR